MHPILDSIKPAVRARHAFQRLKRDIRADDDSGFALTAPVTLTVLKSTARTSSPSLPPLTTLPDPTSTASTQRPSLTPLNSATTITTKIVPTSSSTPTPSSSDKAPSQPTPPAVDPTPPPNTIMPNPDSSSVGSNASGTLSEQKGLSGGAVAGIVIVILLALFGVLFFFVRKRFMNNRQKRRVTWGSPALNKPMSGGNGNGNLSTAEQGGAASLTMPAPDPAYGTTYQSQTVQPYTLSPPPLSYNNPAPSASSAPPIPAGPGSAPQNRMATVQCTFIPTLPDELSISTGEIVRILAEYDDGWALCANAQTDQGMVPLECLGRGSLLDRGSKRASSLAGGDMGSARRY